MSDVTFTVNIPDGVTAAQLRRVLQREVAICVAMYDLRDEPQWVQRTALGQLRREWDEGIAELRARHPEIEWSE